MEREEEGGESKAERGNETAETDGVRTAYYLRKETPCPDLATTKDFLRFHIVVKEELRTKRPWTLLRLLQNGSLLALLGSLERLSLRITGVQFTK
jgi:hypothetical protein